MGGDVPREVVTPEVLDRMTDAMTHRGPNDRGTYSAPGIALGARRLSIVDLDGGHQPMCDDSGSIWGIQNGELYNHADLRETLTKSGHTFRTRCDTEVVPHLYRDYGEFFPRSFAASSASPSGTRTHAEPSSPATGWASSRSTTPGRAISSLFASELKSLLASGLVRPEIDLEAIDAYLSLGFVPGPSTPLRGVSQAPARSFSSLPTRRGVRTERYWDYPLPAPRQAAPRPPPNGRRTCSSDSTRRYGCA